MTARRRAGTFLLLAAILIAGRTIVARLAGAGLGADVPIHAVVVPLAQLAAVELVLAWRKAAP
jgi:hypothetical protein